MLRVIATSERAYVNDCYWDEMDNEFRLKREVKIGDWFDFDGLLWLVTDILD